MDGNQKKVERIPYIVMSNYTEQLERQYQNSIIKLFSESLEYKYLGNFQYQNNEKVNNQGRANSPIIEEELYAYLDEAGYTDMQISEALRQLKDRARLSDRKFVNLLNTNNNVYELLISGVSAKPTPEENEKDVMFFNFDEPLKNHFAIAEEVSYIDSITGYHCRPDLVVYVNGIALCVIELKRSLVSIEEAVRQHLSNECDLIPSFYTTTQFTVASSDKNGFRYATIGTPLKFWCPWKKDTNQTGINISDVDSYKEFFNKENFIFLFRYGVVSDGGIKKVMRPHQFHALIAARTRLQNKDSGVIWHSQGSGKSLTMVWLAAYIKANFEDPRVLVITDRTELDVQLSGDFGDTGNNLHRATSQIDLLNTLQSGTEWLICSLIHKFGNRSNGDGERSENKIPLDKYLAELKQTISINFPYGFKAKGKNIFIFIDECHRTQGGRLHEAMKTIMGQDVMLIGFTGTPLLKDDKANGYAAYSNVSEIRFGTFIHKYLHKQAVEDKVILDLQYEAREVEQYISQKDKLDEKLESITSGLSFERVQLIKERWATLERVYSSSDRIERIGYSILDDMESSNVLTQDWANAMLVAGNIYSAYKYYDFFQNQCENTRLRDHVAVVTSYSPTDYDIRKNTTDTAQSTQDKYKYDMAIRSFQDAGVTDVEKYEAWAKNLFIKQPGRMKLLIVVDKLLTGFDAPCATYLYIDRDMRDHNLFQAICRVNRLGTDIKDENGLIIAKNHKEFGLIVDFKHLFGKIENAITKFNDEDGGLGGFDKEDIEGLLEDSIAKNKKRLIAAENAFNALKAKWQNLNLTNNKLLADYYKTDSDGDPAEERRSTLYSITSALTSSYDNLADFMAKAGYTAQEADRLEMLAREASHINLFIKQNSGDMFDPRNYDPDMRNLLDRYLRAEDAETIVPATADFSFLDLIDYNSNIDEIIEKTKQQTNGNEKSAAEVIEARARAVINNSKDKDPALFKKFSERLQELLDELRHSATNFTEEMQRIIQLIKEIKIGGSAFPKEINKPITKAFWNNRTLCGFSEVEPEAIEQILKVDYIVDYEAGPEFKDPRSAHANLIKDILSENFKSLTEEQIHNIYTIAVQNS